MSLQGLKLQQRHPESADEVRFTSSYGDKWTNLSPELLNLIFAFYARGEITRWPPTAQSYPIVVTHVCSRWRQIALDTSELWSKASYEIFTYKRQNAIQHIRQIQDWFTRCRTPIIQFHFGRPEELVDAYGNDGISHLNYTMPWNPVENIILQAYAPRIQVLHLALDAQHTKEFLMIPSLILLALRDLRLLVSSFEEIDFKQSPTVWCSLPKLRKVQLLGQPLFGGQISESHIPISQLTYLRISWPISTQELHSILKKSTTLEVLRLGRFPTEHYGSDPIWEVDPPSLPVLQEIEFPGSDLFTILQHMQVPQLLRINLAHTRWSPTILDFMAGHPIEVLEMQHLLNPPAPFLHDLILSSTRVRELKLPVNSPFTQELLQLIGSGDVLPCLQHLECGIDHAVCAQPSIIAELVRKRFLIPGSYSLASGDNPGASRRTLRALYLGLTIYYDHDRVLRQFEVCLGRELTQPFQLRVYGNGACVWDGRFYDVAEETLSSCPAGLLSSRRTSLRKLED